jgi:TRAP-type C4-dicarboxylate transport system substrate-binding protein
LRIRTPSSKIRLATFNQYGAAATPMSFSEVYMALQKGVIDGQENPLNNIYTASLYEVQKYLSLSEHIYSFNFFVINESAWGKIPADLQKKLQEADLQVADEYMQMNIKNDKELVGKLKEKGMSVNEVNKDAFIKASKAIWNSYPEWADIVKDIESMQ